MKELLEKGQEDKTMTHLVHEEGSKNLEVSLCTILVLMLILLIDKVFDFKLSFNSLLLDIWLVLVVVFVRHIILVFMMLPFRGGLVNALM